MSGGGADLRDSGGALAWAAESLRGIDGDAAREARWIVEARLGADPLLAPGRPLTARERALVRSDVARRARGEPLAYVLGTAPFRGLLLEVGPGVLIPRPETEGLAGLALEAVAGRAAPRILDVGTGSGCLALALAAERPDARVVATDSSRAALRCARRNAMRLGLARVRLVEADLWPPEEVFDLIVSNPPYVEGESALPPAVADWEPPEALRAGPDGLDVWRRILEGASARLAAGGAIAGEIGEVQGPAAADLARRAGLAAEIRRDLFGKERYLLARRPV